MKKNMEIDDETCRDPNLYCKFRSGCIIYYLYKKRLKEVRSGEKEKIDMENKTAA
ncbi:MAG: hypothetical protein JRJ44_01490 [Deltaproteobacteria bacterium]|nr:hypothetical protein [Deltaproteobacteria bacterium]